MGKNKSKKTKKELADMFERQLNGTAQRSYSEGRLGPEDDGDLCVQLVLDRDNQVVLMEFGYPIAWLGMSKESALSMAKSITELAEKLD